MARTLERTLRLRDLVVIVVGTVIGSGIFVVPATVLRQTGGDATLALGVWVLAGVLSLLGALTYGELGAMRPAAGGLYVFIREAFGEFPAFLYGWTLFFVIGSGSIAALAAAFAGYLDQLVPLTAFAARTASLAMIVLVAAINVRGTRSSASVLTLATAIKVGAIVVMSVALLAAGSGGGADSPPVASPASVPMAAGIALIAVLWAYEGWQYATFAAGETLNPQRNFPLGMALGTALLIGIYCLANIGYIAALGPAGAAASTGIAAEAVRVVFGPVAAHAIAAAILVSIFSAANGITLTAPRVFYAMARDGVFFRQLAGIHPRRGTPAFAVVALCAWAMVLAATGTFDQLLTYVVFTGWIFYALAAASVFVYRARRPDLERPFRVPLYPLTPLLFVVAAGAIVVNALLTQTVQAGMGIAVVLTGAPVYLIWRRRRGRPDFARAESSGHGG
jgi:basic amino acid/polyamine antiporter, APA family